MLTDSTGLVSDVVGSVVVVVESLVVAEALVVVSGSVSKVDAYNRKFPAVGPHAIAV